MTPIALSRSTVRSISGPVELPRYDPATVRAGIVHLGLGGFHRAHMARYTDALMNQDPAARDWGIVGAGLLAADQRMHDCLAPQDGLYTLVERSGTTETARVIGSLASLVYAGESTAGLLAAMDDPAIRIASLTITPAGYCQDAATHALDLDHPLIRADLARPEQPASAIGVLVESLSRRRAAGTTPFTVMSCDNIQHNGAVLRASTLALAARRDPALAAWIEREVAFPATMVDRITPFTAPEDIEHVAHAYGIADRWPVVCEDFTQWVIEDRFPTGRPTWECDSAQFVTDVAPYETMKLRLLNASHVALASLGRLLGLTYVYETVRDPLLRGYMQALMDRETGPTVPPVPGIDLAAYKRRLIERFGNPAVRDTVARINTMGSVHLLVGPLEARLAAGGSVDLLALGLAAWLRLARGEDAEGRPIGLRHPAAADLKARAEQGGPDPTPLLGLTTVFGTLGNEPRLTTPLRVWLGSLYEVGARRTLERAARDLTF